jgi:hypothetical protein
MNVVEESAVTTIDHDAVAQDFLTRQVELLEAGDTAALADRYTEDAIFVRFNSVCRGRAEIKQLFDDYLTENPEVKKIDGVQIFDNLLLYQAQENLNGRPVTAVGTLVFLDTLVWRQTAVFIDQLPGNQ